jgi:hypothetical protein
LIRAVFIRVDDGDTSRSATHNTLRYKKDIR